MEPNSTPIPGEGDGAEAFFGRCHLPSCTRYECQELARDLFPNTSISEASIQGYCSYTLSVGHDRIIQFRPPAHRLSIALANAARDVYGHLAPETQLLTVMRVPRGFFPSPTFEEQYSVANAIDEGIAMVHDDESEPCLDVVSMTRMPGVSLTEFRASPIYKSLLSSDIRKHRRAMVSNFATFIASGWKDRRFKADSVVSSLRGKVGGSMKSRLEKMSGHLPQRFLPLVSTALNRFDEVMALPWVLTHGDVVPANIMILPTHSMSPDLVLAGMLDWAEAEYLPFGVGFYGLEELLGETDPRGHFTYYDEAEELHRLFWEHLAGNIPNFDLRAESHLRGLICISHTVGVLLWHGIAFDNGKLDRVVEEGKDSEEVHRLDLFTSMRMNHLYKNSAATDHQTSPCESWQLTEVCSRAIVRLWTWLRHCILQRVSSRRAHGT